MSLQSNGSNFQLHVALNERQRKCFVPHILPEPLPSKIVITESSPDAYINSVDATKKTFLAAMAKFVESKEFEALTYDLDNNFNITVIHSVSLSMPTN